MVAPARCSIWSAARIAVFLAAPRRNSVAQRSTEDTLPRTDGVYDESRKFETSGERAVGKRRLDEYEIFLIVGFRARNAVQQKQLAFRPLGAFLTTKILNLNDFFHMGHYTSCAAICKIFSARPRNRPAKETNELFL